MPDFLPLTDARLGNWAKHFRDRILAAPQDYSLTPAQSQHYDDLTNQYISAMIVAKSRSTNSGSAVFAKNQARSELRDETRRLARIIRAAPIVSSEQRHALGLGTPANRPTRSKRPGVAPGVSILSTAGHRLTLRLERSGAGRSRPSGTIGAMIFRAIGPTAPATRSDWQFVGTTTRRRHTIRFPDDIAPGTTVWVTACWVGQRLQIGPFADVRSTNIPGGPAAPEAVDVMRLAA